MKTYKVTINDVGTIFWYNDKGQLHREDGPAFESTSGDKCWFENGLYHREDGPAIESASGYKCWYLHGCFHTKESWEKEIAKLKGPTQEEINKALEVLGKATGYKITKG